MLERCISRKSATKQGNCKVPFFMDTTTLPSRDLNTRSLRIALMTPLCSAAFTANRSTVASAFASNFNWQGNFKLVVAPFADTNLFAFSSFPGRGDTA